MSNRSARGDDCEVIVIGAGPYGLAVAAHLKAAGIATQVFGEPMSFWRRNMPKGMKLRSPWRATHIADPDNGAVARRLYRTASGSPAAEPMPLEISSATACGSRTARGSRPRYAAGRARRRRPATASASSRRTAQPSRRAASWWRRASPASDSGRRRSPTCPLPWSAIRPIMPTSACFRGRSRRGDRARPERLRNRPCCCTRRAPRWSWSAGAESIGSAPERRAGRERVGGCAGRWRRPRGSGRFRSTGSPTRPAWSASDARRGCGPQFNARCLRPAPPAGCGRALDGVARRSPAGGSRRGARRRADRADARPRHCRCSTTSCSPPGTGSTSRRLGILGPDLLGRDRVPRRRSEARRPVSIQRARAAFRRRQRGRRATGR